MAKPKLILTIGAPCSGKSTWSKKYVAGNPKFVRFCRDDIRLMLRGALLLDNIGEQIVTQTLMAGVTKALEFGNHVIVDQTNCRLRYINGFVKEFQDVADIRYVLFNEPIETLKKRNQLRALENHMTPIPDDVIERMYGYLQELLKLKDFKELLDARSMVFSGLA
jgi:predicted kinase